jgi:hypothetical protein
MIATLPSSYSDQRALSRDQCAVLGAIVMARATTGHRCPTVEAIQMWTPRYLPATVHGRPRQPLGRVRIRETLHELEGMGMVVELERGHWAVHEEHEDRARRIVNGDLR